MTTRLRLAFIALSATAFALAFASGAHAQEGRIVIVVEGSLGPSTSSAPGPQAGFELAAPVLAPAPAPVLTIAEPVTAPAYAAAPQGAYLPELAAPPSEPRTRPRWGLVAGGAAMAIAAYGMNIGGTALALLLPFWNSNRGQMFAWSLVPVAGPLVQIGYRDGDWQIPLFALSSAVQLAGFVMAFVGTFTRQTVEVETGDLAFTVLPYATSDGAGLAAAGSF